MSCWLVLVEGEGAKGGGEQWSQDRGGWCSWYSWKFNSYSAAEQTFGAVGSVRGGENSSLFDEYNRNVDSIRLFCVFVSRHVAAQTCARAAVLVQLRTTRQV